MWLNPLFERFVEKSPVTVMVRAMREGILAPAKLDELFELRVWGRFIEQRLASWACPRPHSTAS